MFYEANIRHDYIFLLVVFVQLVLSMITLRESCFKFD